MQSLRVLTLFSLFLLKDEKDVLTTLFPMLKLSSCSWIFRSLYMVINYSVMSSVQILFAISMPEILS